MTTNLDRSNPDLQSEAKDRVRNNTPASLNQRIDQAIATRVYDYATKSDAELSHRITELD